MTASFHETIPFSVPHLPDLETLSERFVLKPIGVDTHEADPTPRFILPSVTTANMLPERDKDGVLCLYPESNDVACLFSTRVEERRSAGEGGYRALVVTSQSADGLCTVFGFSDKGDRPELIVNILAEEQLRRICTWRDRWHLELDRVEDRIEIRQTFTANSFGLVSRVTNDLAVHPKKPHPTLSPLLDDPDLIGDVCSHYLSRTLVLAPDEGDGRHDRLRAGWPDPLYRLLWRRTSVQCLAAFSIAYILKQTSLSIRRARGETYFALDYNRPRTSSERD